LSLPHHNSPEENRGESVRLTATASPEIRRTLRVLFREKAVVELRAFGNGIIRSGFFDIQDALAREAAGLDRRGFQVYTTLNEIDPALLERVQNRRVARPTSTTVDADIIRRRWLLLDFDPVRPSGLSSTGEEKASAENRVREVWRFLRKQGWPDPVVADSGNGYHLLYRTDLPNDETSRKLVKDVLQALASRFDDEVVKIDTGVHNAARLIRLYGTVARKGNNTKERPHRRSRILYVKEEVT
jgi:hypothetical protein